MRIRTTGPEDPGELRKAIYAGDVFLLPPTRSSERIVQDAGALLSEELGERPRTAAETLSNDELFSRIGRLRKRLYLEPRFHEAVRSVLTDLGFSLERVAFDPLRMRVVGHQGSRNPSAAPVYYPHRDTWYSHPQTLITVWIPLGDLSAEETFVFFPDFFERAAPNDSEIFDYDEWVCDGWGLKIGWQDRRAGVTARYPRLQGSIDAGPAVGFSCKAGEVLLFSGAHLHETRVHSAGRTRFSLDFRVVDTVDEAAGIGAPNADNRSRGSALRDYTPGITVPMFLAT
jgi:Phytanoyl-CoA dioxygenase (PhyH)